DIPKTLDELLHKKNVCIEPFASKDIKFTTLLIPSNESCSENDTESRNWDQYILEQPYRSYEMLNSQKLPTRKQGAFVIVSRNLEQTDLDDKPLLNCIKIRDEDLEWKNGTVQLLNGPLPNITDQTLFDIIINDSNFSAFSMLTDDLQERLASNNLISTVFVFNNEKFSSLSLSLQARMYQKKGLLLLHFPLLNCIKIRDEDLEWKNGTVQLLNGPLPNITDQTLFDIIINDSNFSAFSMLTDDLQERLASNNLISTVFVFNNEKFSSLSLSLQARMYQKKGCARELIKEHIYDGMLCSPFKENAITSITGIKHRFYKQWDGNNTELIRLDNGRILSTNRVASNGVIHIIDDVILREQSAIDWRDHLEFPGREFLEIVERNIGYEDDPVAIFVPPNDSFRNLTDEKSFVMNHIIMNDSYVTNNLIETAYGSKIPSSAKSVRPVFGCAKTVETPTKYCNTIIYTIDAPLPRTTNTLEELLTARNEFSVFASLLNDSNISLENDRLYTIFLPSNDALSNNQVRALRTNKTMANNFVRRHIFEGLFCSKNLQVRTSNGELPVILKNVRGEYYSGHRVDKKTTFGNINLQDVDMLAVNGILHILESPLKSPQHIARRHQTLCSAFNSI
ncbi:unnamed protein product, partial [Brugia pahangi]|uniref:FAS1 domain-containing protein n=2 Tax=Brugia pahangi TaxID=6280 RepID=A0A0N4T5S4_BRUPA